MTTALVAAAVLAVAAGGLALAANNPPTLDPRGEMSTPGLGGDRGAPAADAPISANPLWGIPLNSLTTTRERPIFLPSRRPPAPAVVAAPRVEPPPPPPIAEPDQPPLSLVGTVSGSTDSYAVFINNTTRDIVRLRTGEGHEGWILLSVKGREAVLEKNRRSAVIELPLPVGEQK